MSLTNFRVAYLCYAVLKPSQCMSSFNHVDSFNQLEYFIFSVAYLYVTSGCIISRLVYIFLKMGQPRPHYVYFCLFKQTL